MSGCCESGGSCLCGSLPVYKSSDVKQPVRFGGNPVKPETLATLEEIGVSDSWVPGRMEEEDAQAVLAFHKFLNSGDWGETFEGERIFITDQESFDYAMGKITAEEYLK